MDHTTGPTHDDVATVERDGQQLIAGLNADGVITDDDAEVLSMQFETLTDELRSCLDCAPQHSGPLSSN
jgi:ribosome recycling factor